MAKLMKVYERVGDPECEHEGCTNSRLRAYKKKNGDGYCFRRQCYPHYYAKRKDLPQFKEKQRLKSLAKSKCPKHKWKEVQKRKDKWEVSITKEFFMKLWDLPCTYCGGEAYGIDRRDNTIGYTEGNSVSCCAPCNYSKNWMSEKEYIAHCQKVTAFQKEVRHR